MLKRVLRIDIEQFTRKALSETGLTAVGIGVSTADGPLQVAVSGYRRRKGSVKVSNDDCWHIGSVGKSFTATLVAKLFENEYPKLDCRLVDLIPDMHVHSSWHECTLYHLLTSTSGLPANFPMSILKIVEDDPLELTKIRQSLIEEALSKPAKFKCGAQFQYSNLGYTTLGYIAETYAKRPFQELITSHVLKPLGLESAGFGAPRGPNEGAEPIGHRVLLGFRFPMDPFKGIADNPAVIAPAGRLHMNLSDLLRYGRAHLNGHSMLKGETWELLHTPHKESYACGWLAFDTSRGNGEMIWHNGSNTMWYTLLILVPSKDVVLAFVTNDGAIRKAERKFFEVANLILDEI